MRMLKTQVLLLLLAVVVVGGLGADIVLKNRAESRLAAEIVTRAPGTTGVQARIRSFPFVGRLLVSGRVAQIDVTAQHASPGGVSLFDIRLRVEDVVMDAGEATRGRAVVRSIGRGSLQADLGQDEINARLPKQFQVRLQQGAAVISGPGGAEGTLTAKDGRVQLRVGGRSVLDLAVPTSALLPCTPVGTFVAGAVRLTCNFTEVPEVLVDLAN